MMKHKLFYFLLLLFFCVSCEKETIGTDAEQPETIDDGGSEEGEFDFDSDAMQLPILSVSDFLEGDFGTDYVGVEGYIVGACKANIKNAEWCEPFSFNNALLLADDPGETGVDKVIAIQLRTKEMQAVYGLGLNPENYQRRIIFYGTKQRYLGIWGMKKDVWAGEWIDESRIYGKKFAEKDKSCYICIRKHIKND